MLSSLFTNPLSFILWALAMVTAITIHEFAHAFTAVKLGDPTPKIQKRLTLNPLAHLDPFGTLLLLLIRFGWGKPVQFDPYNLKNPRRDAALISLAGPFSNLVLASLLSLILRISVSPFSPFAVLAILLPPFIYLNIILAIFNLIPIHPLDGGKILVGILPQPDASIVDRFLTQYGTFILIFMIFPFWGDGSPILHLISPVINFLLNIYLPGGGPV